MFTWSKSNPYLTATIVVCLVVFLLWLRLWYITMQAYSVESNIGMSAHGQFGDAFGTLNALFTGFALAGLVYTALLQRKQARDQEADSRANQLAMQRQLREQYLTARLNATVAVLQAYEAELRYKKEPLSLAEEYTLKQVAAGTRHQSSILLAEARLGFDHSIPDDKVEIYAILNYLIQLFNDYKWLIISIGHELQPRSGEIVSQMCGDMGSLSRALRQTKPSIVESLKVHSNDLMKHCSTQDEAIAWCERFVSGTLNAEPYI